MIRPLPQEFWEWFSLSKVTAHRFLFFQNLSRNFTKRIFFRKPYFQTCPYQIKFSFLPLSKLYYPPSCRVPLFLDKLPGPCRLCHIPWLNPNSFLLFAGIWYIYIYNHGHRPPATLHAKKQTPPNNTKLAANPLWSTLGSSKMASPQKQKNVGVAITDPFHVTSALCRAWSVMIDHDHHLGGCWIPCYICSPLPPCPFRGCSIKFDKLYPRHAQWQLISSILYIYIYIPSLSSSPVFHNFHADFTY